MKTHTTLGLQAIAGAEKLLDRPSSFLSVARQIACCHHEKWDGSGYPHGLAGEAIPLPARLMAVADVYDALISRGIYKEPFPHEQAAAMIEAGSGSHFDPTVVSAFLQRSGNLSRHRPALPGRVNRSVLCGGRGQRLPRPTPPGLIPGTDGGDPGTLSWINTIWPKAREHPLCPRFQRFQRPVG
jgi:hypothetical protein